MKQINKTLLILALFSIAMGFFESAVVIYLRKIYYPEGFRFPLVPLERNITSVELLRELATVIMLWSISYLAGRSPSQRFANFLFCFGIWDIFYYVFLKAFLNWPESLFTPDILFLIPVPWVGPVLAPCIVSLNMITIAMLIHFRNEQGILKLKENLLMLAGSLIIILSFTRHYEKFIYLVDGNAITMADGASEFNWLIFLAGEILVLLATMYISKAPVSFIRSKSSLYKGIPDEGI